MKILSILYQLFQESFFIKLITKRQKNFQIFIQVREIFFQLISQISHFSSVFQGVKFRFILQKFTFNLFNFRINKMAKLARIFRDYQGRKNIIEFVKKYKKLTLKEIRGKILPKPRVEFFGIFENFHLQMRPLRN